jgi:methylthioribose-1-phosphate isomerase
LCSRPTAVNLLDAARKLRVRVAAELRAPGASATSVTGAVIAAAEAMMQADIDMNRALGAHGRAAMLQAAAAPGRGVGGGEGGLRVLTHCNTGSLATVQYGTALGCVRALHAAGELAHAFCTETRCALAPFGLGYSVPLMCCRRPLRLLPAREPASREQYVAQL